MSKKSRKPKDITDFHSGCREEHLKIRYGKWQKSGWDGGKIGSNQCTWQDTASQIDKGYNLFIFVTCHDEN